MKHFNSIKLLSAFLLMPFISQAEIKVDIDVSGRQTSEVTEVGYSAWVPTSGNYSQDGITFKLSNGSSSGELSTTWYKAGVQSPNYAKFSCDAAYVKDCTTKDATLILTISGLSAGSHSLLTYHNAVGDYSSTTLSNMDIYVNNNKVVSALTPSKRALSVYESKSAYLTFSVTAGQSVTIKFVANTSTSVNDYNVYLNGFALDVPNSADQASSPSPSNGDLHVNGDSKSVTLSWTAAASASSHTIYVGTDSATVEKATTSTSGVYKGNQTSTTYKLSNLYSMNTYWWRIDEVQSNGTVTKGTLWKFRPRQLAFPGAEGYGKYATGGRGGKVVYVTNLNDDGAGSFREAITNDIGPRTILFAVAGRIQLQSRLTCSSQFVTIAGQTAPGRGVCFSTSPFGVGSESICQFIRLRLGSGETADGIGMAGAQYSITDHCSVGWTIDEAFSSRNAKNMTLQKMLISEALNIAGHKNYPAGTGHGYAATIGGDIGSFHHNLLAHNQGRNWSMGGGLDGNGYYAGRLDIFNNVVYNWWHRVTDGGAHEVNFVGNYYKRGAASESSNMDYMLSADLEGTGKGSQAYYFHNNIMAHKDGSYIHDGTDDSKGRRYTLSNGQELTWDVWNSKPFFESEATIESARNAYKSVLSDVGCNMPVLDSHDVRMIDETLDGTYSCTGAQSKVGGIIDASSESKEGDYSYYTSDSWDLTTYDTDLDGLPNWWEEMMGTNPKSATGDFSDSNADTDGDGYTMLEEFLYYMSVPHQTTTPGTTVTFDLADQFIGFSKTKPTYSVAENNDGLTISISSSKLSVSSKTAGVHYFKIKVKDSENDVMTRTFAICAEGKIVETTATLEKCGGGSAIQTINLGDEIKSFCYSWTDASTVSTTGFPKGLNLLIDNDAQKITISGTPTETGEFNFTVTTEGATNNASASGKITVTRQPATLIYETESTDLWTNTANWSKNLIPSSTDTAVIRSGEVKVSSTPEVVLVNVEENGTFRITGAEVDVNKIILQGGTLKSYTSNPLFTLNTSLQVDEASTLMVGSIATSVFELTGSLTGTEDLTKTSVGILKLSEDASDYSGNWTISQGQIWVNAANALGSGTILVKDSTQLTVSVEATAGTIELEDNSTLQLDADLTVAAATIQGNPLNKGVYTSSDYPQLIKGTGSLIVTEDITGLMLLSSDKTSVVITPNPARDETTIIITSNGGKAQLMLIDVKGEVIYEDNIVLSAGENEFVIALDKYKQGIYLLRILLEDEVQIQKLVVR